MQTPEEQTMSQMVANSKQEAAQYWQELQQKQIDGIMAKSFGERWLQAVNESSRVIL